MSKTIDVQLNSRSIKQAIEELKAYKVELHKKNEQFVAALLEKGIAKAYEKTADTGGAFGTHQMGRYITFMQEVEGANGRLIGSSVRLYEVWQAQNGETHEGEISPLWALEFGTARLALSPSEANARFGVNAGQGSNSKYGHSNDLVWYIPEEFNEDGTVKSWKTLTAITPTMPMYNASLEMIREIEATAREVFGNG